MRFLSPLFSILLAPLLAVTPVMAQMPASTAQGDVLAPSSLQLRIPGSETRTASAGSRSAQGITVEVSDGSGAHVANAVVVFRLPDSGPSASFGDGSLTAVAYTDANGRAQVSDIHWGSTPGLVDIRVTAVKGTTHAGLLLEQTLTAAPGSQSIPAAPMRVPESPSAAIEAPAQGPPTPGKMDEGKRTPGVTVEHPLSHSRATAKDDAPVTAQPIPVSSALADDDSPDANVPIRHMARTGADEAEVPRVSISSAGRASSGGHSKAKWLIAIAVAAGAGAALAMTHSGSSSGSSASSVSIGSPTISVGHP